MTSPAVFLDRDDTLIANRDVVPHGDLGDPALVRPLPGALDALRRLKAAGLATVIITNQGGVARGRYTEDDVRRVHEQVALQLDRLIDAFYFCPYHPEGSVPHYTREHPTRKPAPGMLLRAAADLDLDLPNSWLIGDALRDCQAGRAAGVRTILLTGADHVRPNRPRVEPDDPSVDHVAETLLDAADVILAERTRTTTT